MNYYEHHIGDWVEATAHLSFVEEGCYGRLIRKYYASEKPLPVDLKAVERLIGARTKEERSAVKNILEEFFELRDDGWHQDRCDIEIERFQAKSRTAKANANARWSSSNGNAPASDPHMPNGCNGNAPASFSHQVGNALQSPVPNPQSPDLPPPTPPSPGGATRQRRSPDRIERDRALAAWTEVTTKQGATDDPKARVAMRTIGGYSRIRLRTEREESQIRSEFVEAYRSAP